MTQHTQRWIEGIMRMPLTGRRKASAIIALGGLLALTACSKASSVWAVTAGQKPATDITAVQQVVDQVKQLPAFSPPGPAFDASKARGKTIVNISLNSTVPFNNIVDQSMQDAATAAGVKLIQYTNQGQPSQWIQGIDAAIANHAALITLEGSPDPKLLGPQINAARAAGIPVISTHLYDTSYVDTALKKLPDLTALVGASHYRAGTLMADYAIVNSGARVNALFISSNEVQPSAGIASAFSSELTRRCPKTCRATVVNIPITDWSSKVPTAVQTALIKDPSINYVAPVFDGMTPFLVTGISQAGKNASVRIVAYNGTASVLQMIQRKNLVIADIGEPLEWLGWANIDEALRILSGAAPLKDEHTPLRLFDASNVKDAGQPASQTAGYGDPGNFKSGFKKLWGLSS